MKRTIGLLVAALTAWNCMTAQEAKPFLRNVQPRRTVYVDFDRITHIVFPSNAVSVDYIREDYISAGRVKEVPSIVRVQAQQENFGDTINLTVVCQNGEVYPFTVLYLPDSTEYSFVAYADNNIYRENYGILLNDRNIVNMFFPANVIYCWHGNEERLQVEYGNNMVKVATTFDSIPESNLFVADRSGGLFEITVQQGKSESYTYNFDDSRQYTAILDVNSIEMENLLAGMRAAKRNIYSVGVIRNKLEMSLANLFVHKDHLFFAFDIHNNANIDYDVDFVKCFIRDKKTSKNSTQQEILQEPVWQADFAKKIAGRSKNRFFLVFNKFTIPDDKILLVEMYEKGGGRHMALQVLNEYLINSQLLK